MVPPKLKDPGSLTIPIEIGGVNFGKTLRDLEASINLISLLGFRDLRETSITLQLVGRSLMRLKRVIDDVLVRVRQFILPVDFTVLKFKEDLKIPILLGRTFLATSRATIDVGRGEFTMNIDGEVEFFRCVCPDPKTREFLAYSGQFQAIGLLYNHAGDDGRCFKWCVFAGSRAKMRGIRVKKKGVVARQTVNQFVGLKISRHLLVPGTLCQHYYEGVTYHPKIDF
ncbi:Retrovirus-related Pol polyprotein from transposon opus [Gossypium australe]|uniref:Retrovirus-related Pol polyprotein from transposon opus n=1 Tax=Gossypium australe TaxID=47621 RepID=A0A5B6X0T5_9ROSI|nr:Retrovirus-related Pol polyprotein from transposon opus [Gossypium australe]